MGDGGKKRGKFGIKRSRKRKKFSLQTRKNIYRTEENKIIIHILLNYRTRGAKISILFDGFRMGVEDVFGPKKYIFIRLFFIITVIHPLRNVL